MTKLVEPRVALASIFQALQGADMDAGGTDADMLEAVLGLQGQAPPDGKRHLQPQGRPFPERSETPEAEAAAKLRDSWQLASSRDRNYDRDCLQGYFSLTLPHLPTLAALAQEVRAAGHRTVIVCGAGPIGKLAADYLTQAGVEVLALTDRLALGLELRGGRFPVVSLRAGLALAPEAALVAAIASSRAVLGEIRDLCRDRGQAQPALFPIARV